MPKPNEDAQPTATKPLASTGDPAAPFVVGAVGVATTATVATVAAATTATADTAE